eukprot:1786817-Pleurochrysis_carterae.AAC.2
MRLRSRSQVQRRVLPPTTDDFADKVKSGMLWTELDAKLREGVQAEADSLQRRRRASSHAHRARNLRAHARPTPSSCAHALCAPHRTSNALASGARPCAAAKDSGCSAAPSAYARARSPHPRCTAAGSQGSPPCRSSAQLSLHLLRSSQAYLTSACSQGTAATSNCVVACLR